METAPAVVDQLFFRRRSQADGLMDLIQQFVHFGMKDSLENVFLAGIIVIQGTLGLAQTPGNIAHRCLFKPGLLEKGSGSVNYIPDYDLILLKHFGHALTTFTPQIYTFSSPFFG